MLQYWDYAKTGRLVYALQILIFEAFSCPYTITVEK